MSLKPRDLQIMQEIVDVNGKCLDSKRCEDCPFRASCLPEFLNPKPLTENQRLRQALDILTFYSLLDDEDVEYGNEIKF